MNTAQLDWNDQHGRNPAPVTRLPLASLYPLLDRIRNDNRYRPQFAAWIVSNFHIWIAFKKQADLIWHSGRKHYSARTIIEYLRHETFLRGTGEWKVNNNAAPDMARLYIALYPARADLFEFRQQVTSDRRQTAGEGRTP